MKPSVFIIVQLCTFLLLQSCAPKERLPEPYPADSLGKINRWILDSMRTFYYWNEAIPAKTDASLSPGEYFKSLLSGEDRFSWISNQADVLPPSSTYHTYGFHYALVQPSGYEGYIGVVMYVNGGGAAARAGLQRGSYFVAVNGEKMHAGNVEQVQRWLQAPEELQLVTADGSWSPADTVTLYPGYLGENPVRLTRTFQSGGITTGYLYYNAFDERYDDKLLEAFAALKQAGAGELILDLRYNTGGSVAGAAKMAGMIAEKLSAAETWAIYEGNHRQGKRVNSLQAVLHTSPAAAGKQYAALQQRRLPLQRVFILATGATASAAEMVIHNLKPFIPVIQIGEATTGKDEASFTITDRRVPKQVEWTLQPIVYKLLDKNGQGGYSNGLQPQFPASETATLPLGAFGTGEDPLVRQALTIIYGPAFPGIPQDMRKIPVRTIFRSATGTAAMAAPVQIIDVE